MAKRAVVLAIAIGVGCGGAGKGAPRGETESADPAPGELSRGDDTMPDARYRVLLDRDVPVGWVDCDVDDDCVAVEVGCCNHCNGGALVGANRAHQGMMRRELAKVGCEQPCTQSACDQVSAHSAACETSTCRIEDPHE